jgi:hypothetical protein
MQNKVEDSPMLKEQRARKTLKLSYIYLDSTSSFHQMFRAKYMTDVHQIDIALRGKCNGGESHSDEKGCVLDMFCMWLVCSSIANLLSLPTLERDGYVCSYKTNLPWIVECPDGTILKFKRDRGLCEGFPYIDMENLQDHVFKTTNDVIADHHRESNTTNVEDRVKAFKELPKKNAFVFLQTVRQNMEGFTKHKVKGANLACKAQAILGHPSSKELSQVVSNNFGINNCPINPIDISNADAIYGRDLGGIRGKTVRKKPERVHGETLKIPKDFYKLHHFVTLTADIMYVNGVAFLTTLSRKISLRTMEHIQS